MASQPITDPVAAGQAREVELAEIEAQIAAVNPHTLDLGLPVGLQDDGASF